MICAVLQARVSSRRLPGKVLKDILGKPMLLRQIERVQRSRCIDHLLIATSPDASDDPIAALCRGQSIDCYRGSLDDVLDRYYQAVRVMRPEHVVRLTGDCPLCDPELIDANIRFHLDGDYDYSSNALTPTYPDGLDVEVFKFSVLEMAWKEAKLKSEREHVTPYMYNHPEKFMIGGLRNDKDLSYLRWTVDESRDFDFVCKVYETLYPENHCFATADILNFLSKQPQIVRLNEGIGRNEGYERSLEKDKPHA